jgi:phosphatidylinositol glycan class V
LLEVRRPLSWTHSAKPCVSALSSVLPSLRQQGHPACEILAALLVSNLSNATATVLLYELTSVLFKGHTKSRSIAVVTTMLHIICPAGIFLSTPYSESLYSMLAFAGYYVFSSARHTSMGSSSLCTPLILLSATLFSLACLVRSNGILNGLLFLIDFVVSICRCWKRPQVEKLIQIFMLGIGGLIIAAGVMLPQVLAWQQFCGSDAAIRPQWCDRIIPSIYSWVQEHYWLVFPGVLDSVPLTSSPGTWDFLDIGPFLMSHYSHWQLPP